MARENDGTAQPEAPAHVPDSTPESRPTGRQARPWRSNVSQRAAAAAAESRRNKPSQDEPAADTPDEDVSLAELASLISAVKTHADARYDAMGDQLAELTTRVDALAGQGAGGDDQGSEEPDPSTLKSWTERATPEQWAELVRWVDWMQAKYSVSGRSMDPLPPCWPAHENVAEELAALHLSWQAALIDEANAQGVSDAALYWHDRWLWPTRERLSGSFLERCRVGRHELPMPPQATNPAFIPKTGE